MEQNFVLSGFYMNFSPETFVISPLFIIINNFHSLFLFVSLVFNFYFQSPLVDFPKFFFSVSQTAGKKKRRNPERVCLFFLVFFFRGNFRSRMEKEGKINLKRFDEAAFSTWCIGSRNNFLSFPFPFRHIQIEYYVPLLFIVITLKGVRCSRHHFSFLDCLRVAHVYCSIIVDYQRREETLSGKC